MPFTPDSKAPITNDPEQLGEMIRQIIPTAVFSAEDDGHLIISTGLKIGNTGLEFMDGAPVG